MISSPNIIPCPLNVAAKHHGSRPAVIWGSRRITYQQLNQYVNTTVKAFKERGIKASSRVALFSGNSVEAVVILFSLWRLGAVACPINPRFPHQTVLALLKKVRAQAVIVGGPKDLSGVKTDMPKIFITDLIVFDVKDSFYKDAGAMSLTVDLQREAAIVFTSGTSADAKAVVLTYENLYFNALGSNECISLQKDDRWLLSLPLFHVSGLGVLFRALLSGAAVVIAAAEDVGRVLSEGKATHVSMVATQLYRLLNDQTFVGAQRLSSSEDAVPLRAILLGGGAIPQNLVEQALRLKLPVYVSYGLTETASQVATGRVVSAEKNCAAVLPYCEIKISSDGEICVRGATLFKGYLEGDEIRLPLDRDGWFHTGDLGTMDAQGCLYVVGRKDNMFISGGENIHPEEIEQALLKIDSIAQAVVVPQPDQEFGERPVAFIRWKTTTQTETGDALKIFLLQELPKFKIPVAFYSWPGVLGEKGIKIDRRYFVTLAREKS